MTDEQNEKIIEKIENDCTSKDIINLVGNLDKEDLLGLIRQIYDDKKCIKAKNWIIDYLAWIIFYERL